MRPSRPEAAPRLLPALKLAGDSTGTICSISAKHLRRPRSRDLVLPTKAFVEELPEALDLVTRLQLEVIAFDLRTIGHVYDQIRGRANDFGPNDRISEPAQTTLILDLWSLIDRAYSLFKMLERLPDPLVEHNTMELIGKYKSIISTMRNFMDHSSVRVLQLAHKHDYNPLLGSVTFYIGEEQSDQNFPYRRKPL
jgi:hypothetical protein